MQTVDIIKGIVETLTYPIKIISQTTESEIITLNVDCTGWAHSGSKLTIDGKVFKVKSFIIGEKLQVKPIKTGDTIEVDSFILPAPTYFHGTHKDVKAQVNAINDKTTISPMVWLKEIYRDKKTTDPLSAIDRDSDLMILFLDSAKSQDWLTGDHYINIINPIQTLVDLFTEKLSNNRFFTEEFDTEETNIINASMDGKQESSIFDYNLSGKIYRLFAEIRKDLSCTTNNNC